MTGTSVLYMLLGAALVAVGVLASALADRIRGLRASREVPQPRALRTEKGAPQRGAISVVEPTEVLRSGPVKPRTVRAEQKANTTEGGDDVIAALVGSGFKKATAAEATWACTAAERGTIEGWTAAALRRARGGLS
ncbi:MAG TPA: hypothetical protein VLE97_06345 [Gaiellaceae bacterium]|nr:hypothetical protein [Gaiellaceae bacterium]